METFSYDFLLKLERDRKWMLVSTDLEEQNSLLRTMKKITKLRGCDFG